MRSLGPSVLLSVLAHGGAVATGGALGALWLAGTPPTLEPALYVDLVEPVVALSDRIAPGAEPAARPRPPERIAGRFGIADPATGARQDVPAQPDAGEPKESPMRVPGSFAMAPPEVVRPPLAPVTPERRVSPPEPAAPTARATPGAPESPAPAPAPIPHPTLAPVIPPSEAVTTSSPAPPASPRLAPDEGQGTPIASSAGRGGDLTPAPSSGASSTAEVFGGAVRGPEGSAARGVARFAPGAAGSSGAGDGTVPPEYETYVRALRQRVQDRLVYPWMAVRRGQQGIVELEVRVGPEGRLVGVEVVAGPSAETLRAAAVTAVRGAAPFPFPPGVEGRALVIRLPVEFQLR